jgi:hypothetical protein
LLAVLSRIIAIDADEFHSSMSSTSMANCLLFGAETGGCNSTVRSSTAYATVHSRDASQCTTTVEVQKTNICYVRYCSCSTSFQTAVNQVFQYFLLKNKRQFPHYSGVGLRHIISSFTFGSVVSYLSSFFYEVLCSLSKQDKINVS